MPISTPADTCPELLIVGSIGIDTIITPNQTSKDIVGGSAIYASYAASFFTKPAISSIAGKDFPESAFTMLKERGIDIAGIEIKGETFRWEGEYKGEMNAAITHKTAINSFADFSAVLPKNYSKAKFVLLGNIDPDLQLKALSQLEKPIFIALDSMDLWIRIKKESLIKAIKKVDALIINDGEARMLFSTSNLREAASQAMALGLKYFIVKKGDNGCFMFTKDKVFSTQGYPLRVLKDPTGCGDVFAGSIMGYLAHAGKVDEGLMRKAILHGCVLASFNAQDFSLGQLQKISQKDIEKRYNIFLDMRHIPS